MLRIWLRGYNLGPGTSFDLSSRAGYLEGDLNLRSHIDLYRDLSLQAYRRSRFCHPYILYRLIIPRHRIICSGRQRVHESRQLLSPLSLNSGLQFPELTLLRTSVSRWVELFARVIEEFLGNWRFPGNLESSPANIVRWTTTLTFYYGLPPRVFGIKTHRAKGPTGKRPHFW